MSGESSGFQEFGKPDDIVPLIEGGDNDGEFRP